MLMPEYLEINRDQPFEIDTIRRIRVKKTAKNFVNIVKILGLQSHDIRELTVLVSSDKISGDPK